MFICTLDGLYSHSDRTFSFLKETYDEGDIFMEPSTLEVEARCAIPHTGKNLVPGIAVGFVINNSIFAIESFVPTVL